MTEGECVLAGEFAGQGRRDPAGPDLETGDAEVGGPSMRPLPPNPALKQLEALIGEWDVEVPRVPGSSWEHDFDLIYTKTR
jgi:hypothetical protein